VINAIVIFALILNVNGNGFKVGQRAANFTLKTFAGEKVSLSDQRGKVVLLDFWASWCAPCKEEMPFLDLLQKTYGGEDFVVLAINIDNHPRNAVEFLKRYSIKLTSLWDENKQVVAAYNIETMPSSILIDQEGWIRAIHSGFRVEDFPRYKQEVEKLIKAGRKKSSPRASRGN
jgi:thiol-disulfide isomerase/thioredoxin